MDVRTHIWSFTFPPVSDASYPAGHARPKPPVVFERGETVHNRVGIHYFVNRLMTEAVAVDYMKHGHGAALAATWPADSATIDLSDLMHSASMSVKGDFEAPHALNFYFEVLMTSPAGSVINLLLAQSGSGHWLLTRLVHIGKARRL
jgi:hypothetical protein